MEVKKLSGLLKESDTDKYAKEQLYWNDVWESYAEEAESIYGNLTTKEAISRLISETNFKVRSKASNAEELGVWIKVGDICYIDFGVNYINEAGFQHFGLILSMMNNKILVIPMTSNKRTCKEAIAGGGKYHLMFLGKVDGLYKYSTLFLNDAKYINSARVIDVKGNIPVDGELFRRIKTRFHEIVG